MEALIEELKELKNSGYCSDSVCINSHNASVPLFSLTLHHSSPNFRRSMLTPLRDLQMT